MAVLDAYPQLVEAVGSIADLQGQRFAIIAGSISSTCGKPSPITTSCLRNASASNASVPHGRQSLIARITTG